MEFRKMVMTTLYVRQQKRHRYIEQYFGLCGWGEGDDLGEWLVSYLKKRKKKCKKHKHMEIKQHDSK